MAQGHQLELLSSGEVLFRNFLFIAKKKLFGLYKNFEVLLANFGTAEFNLKYNGPDETF